MTIIEQTLTTDDIAALLAGDVVACANGRIRLMLDEASVARAQLREALRLLLAAPERIAA